MLSKFINQLKCILSKRHKVRGEPRMFATGLSTLKFTGAIRHNKVPSHNAGLGHWMVCGGGGGREGERDGG